MKSILNEFRFLTRISSNQTEMDVITGKEGRDISKESIPTGYYSELNEKKIVTL